MFAILYGPYLADGIGEADFRTQASDDVALMPVVMSQRFWCSHGLIWNPNLDRGIRVSEIFRQDSDNREGLAVEMDLTPDDRSDRQRTGARRCSK